ncbi:MAG: DMT family transporter [Desulfarculaceae bacterium]|nr:DMT family transporter [Desulfarculaceae bacterium]
MTLFPSNTGAAFLKGDNLKTFLGCLSVFGSAFLFYLATVVVKWSSNAGLSIDPAFFVFSRFLAGFIFICIYMGIARTPPKPTNYHYLIGRTVANCLAVYCFFRAVDLTSVAEGNILNMTYPLFITLFSWILFKRERDLVSVLIVLAAFAGVWLILSPGDMDLNPDSIWGLASGISAAVAIMYLNLSRRVHDTETTLFFLFGLGGVIIFLVFRKEIFMPDIEIFKYLLMCSFFSVAGQYFITLGFKFVTSVEGGIISSTRILLAAVLGPYLTSDPALSAAGWAGAFLIFAGNVYLTLRKVK